jgi:hypothetical protein
VEEISADDARDIALALEDLVSGTVTAVDASGVTVSYTLDDGSSAEVRGHFIFRCSNVMVSWCAIWCYTPIDSNEPVMRLTQSFSSIGQAARSSKSSLQQG